MTLWKYDTFDRLYLNFRTLRIERQHLHMNVDTGKLTWIKAR